MAGVRIRGVTKRFGTTEVLKGVDLAVPEGAFAVLVGPSGCGKSTLLRLVAGLEEVTEGAIEFGKRDVTSLAPRDRDVAMVFQSYALYPHMTVRDNIAFGLKLRKLDRDTIASRVGHVAETLGLEDLLDRYPRALSGGQRQRVAMGRAIARRPSVFLFDEPLSNLDPALRNQVRVDIRRLHDDLSTTSVYVTHDQVEAMTLADVLFVLESGVVQQSGSPLEIFRRPANRFVASFVGSPAMNFLPARLRNGRHGWTCEIEDAGHQVPLRDPGAFAGLEPGAPVAVGIRPTDVERSTDPGEEDLRLEIDLVETLGSVSHAHGKFGPSPFIAAIDGSLAVERGDTVPLRVTDLHLFHPDSGAALRR